MNKVLLATVLLLTNSAFADYAGSGNPGESILFNCTSTVNGDQFQIVKDNQGYTWLRERIRATGQIGYVRTHCNGENLTATATAGGVRFDNNCTNLASGGNPIVQINYKNPFPGSGGGPTGVIYQWLFLSEASAVKAVIPVTCLSRQN